MNIVLHEGEALDAHSDVLVLWMHKGAKEPQVPFASVDKLLSGHLAMHVREEGFTGALGEKIVLPTFGRMQAKKVIVIGLGDARAGTDVLRKAGGHAAKILHQIKAKHVSIVFPLVSTDIEQAMCCFSEGIRLAAYAFDEHFGVGQTHKRVPVEHIDIYGIRRAAVRAAQKGLDRGNVLASATNVARDLVNRSPRHMRPLDLAEAARSLVVRGQNIACKIYSRERMEQMKMGAALAVAEGSVHPPFFVHLVYQPKKKAKRVIAIVGKGVTFDSGGLSLKPADSMLAMKTDMGGAASVIGMFHALKHMDLDVEVHGICIAVENMPSGHAYRPGDVVRAMNGMTIEIHNTDAEGRVILADALSYVVKKVHPDCVIDIATLTGATIVALGDDCTSAMSNNRALIKSVLRAAKRAGELMWELPLISHYDEALKSRVADMNNTGGRSAGAIKGGLFLKRFIADVPWVHLDIGGSVFCEKEYRPDLPYGATGIGVRTLIEFVEGDK